MNDKKFLDGQIEIEQPEELNTEMKEDVRNGEDTAEKGRAMPAGLAAVPDSERIKFTDTKEYQDNPFTYFENSEINVQLASASFRYDVTDFVVPGRNGFDLIIARRYDSGCANILDLSTNLLNNNEVTGSKDNRHNIGTFGLGYGWSFNFPSIESIPKRVYGQEKKFKSANGYILHLEDGRSLKTDLYMTKFNDYNLEDVKIMKVSGNISHPSRASITKRYHLIIEYKNGNRDYYRNYIQYSTGLDDLMVVPNYKLVARQDRFGNVICFDFVDYGGMTIIDTWGREFILQKNSDGMTWKFPEGISGNPPSYKIDYLEAQSLKPQKLVAATNLIGSTTSYEYYDKKTFTKTMKLGTESVKYTTGTSNRPYMLLKKVIYPIGASTEFVFDSGKYMEFKDDYDGHIIQFPLLEKRDMIGDDIHNQVKYSYTMGGRGTYIATAEVTNHETIRENYQFSSKGLMKEKKTYDNKVLVSKSEYTYNEDKLMTSAIDEVYSEGNTSKLLKKETKWEYTANAEVEKETWIYHEDPELNQVCTTSYGDYGIILSTEKKKGSDIICETNEVHPGRNQVVRCHRIYEGGVLKEKTIYDYGSEDYQYCVTGEKRYFMPDSGNLEVSDNYAETALQYDSTKFTHQCVSKSITDIRDADDKYCGVVEEHFDYDTWGRLIKSTDPRGQVSMFSYDELGRIKEELLPSVNGQPVICKTEYNDEENYITKTDAGGQKTRIHYTPLGQISQICLAAADKPTPDDVVLKEFLYNAWGEMVSAITYDGNGIGTNHIKKNENYEYDSFKRIVSRHIPQAGYKESYHYDEVFPDLENAEKNYYRIWTKIEGDRSAPDVETVIYKDQKGQIRKEFLAGIRIAAYEYDNMGNITHKRDAGDKAEYCRYDYAGRAVEVTRTDDGELRTVSIEYDAVGNKRVSRDEAGNETEYRYDKAGRLIQMTAPFDDRRMRANYYYDAAGNVTMEKWEQDDGWQEVRNVYDARNRLTDTYQYISFANWIRTRYQYDLLDRVVFMRTGDTQSADGKQIKKYTYNRFGHITAMTDARGCSEHYEYDKTGRLQGKTDRNGNRTEYQYDALDRLIKETVKILNADGIVVNEREQAYSNTGYLIRQASRQTAEGQASVFLESRYYYDEKGQLIRQEDPGNVVKHYTYDEVGNRRSFCLQRDGQSKPEISLFYICDNLNRLKQVRRECAVGSILAEYRYDERGNRKSLSYPQTGIETSFRYNQGNRVVFMETRRQGIVISVWRYEYDVDGNLLKKIDETNITPVTHTYRYDRMGRLKQEDNPGWKRVNYEYDAYSNRVSMKVEGKTKEELASVTTYDYGLNNWLEKETKKEGAVTEIRNYRYDDNGNETFRLWEKTGPKPDYPGSAVLSGSGQGVNPTIYEWRHYNGFNQLIRINQDDREIFYCYRGDGLRHSSEVRELTDSRGKTKVLYWDGSNIVAEQADGRLLKRYLRGTNLIAGETDHMVYYIHNGHGDVSQIWSNGAYSATYEYDAFGGEKGYRVEDENPFRYCGEYLDLNSGAYYLRARDYRPATGRFTSEDPARDGLNWYTYCKGNPILYVDSNGLECYIFYLSEWKHEALDDQKRLMEFYGLSQAEVNLIEVNSKSDITNGWNSMGKDASGKSVAIDAVVINTHADPNALAGQDTSGVWWSFDSSDIGSLDNKNLDSLSLYGCNAGHIDYQDTNPASQFAKKVHGAPVLASDGTVYSSWNAFGLMPMKYTSKNDKTFRTWRNGAAPTSTRDNEGWVVYQYGNEQSYMSASAGKALSVSQMNNLLSGFEKIMQVINVLPFC